ncbi:amino acid adenylation domain-containing protein, partial [Lysobacter gummosus]|uniref:amino acid adenylation domain-containing protein n=1 Tax=Lysobacter gummosus TaxID=262324 RepID=UPI003628E274
RWLADGTIEYLGRNDFQVKIRGFRIELGEIEAKLAACEGVRDAVVIAREDTPGDRRLVAYLVMREGAAWSVPELREALSRDLAEYMVPSAFVALDALPLTTNGKLDRQALPAPDQASVSQREYEAPQGETETAIAEVWQELLGLDRVGRHDHFFELGGHSLLVIGLIERLRLRGLNADVRTVFTVPVLSAFAERVLAQVTSTPDRIADNVIDTHTSRITPDLLPLVDLTQEQIDAIVASVPGGTGNVQDIYPLGPLQEGILFHHLIESERPGDAYLMRSLIAFDSRERVDSFVDALQQVISRHDILRSAPRWQGLARPVQVVHRRAPMPVELLTVAEDRPAMQTLLAASDPTRIKLDLEKAPLLRAYVVEDYATGEWLMALLNHHLVDDNYSMQLLHKEVRLILQGQEHLLAAPQPYRNFIARTHAVPDSVHEAYFRERLGDVDEPTAPFGVLNVQGSDTGAQARVDLPAATARRVREAARQQGVTPAVLFHVAWALVLSRCSGRDDVVFGTVLSGRLQGSEAADQVVGMFINTLPIRVRLGGVSLSEAIAQAYRSLGELLEHEQASLTLAQRCSAVAPPLPLFTTLINFRHGQMLQDAQNPSASSWQGVRALGTEERSNYPLGICVDDIGEGFSLTAQTSHGIDADRIVAYLHTAVDSMLAALDAEPAIALQALEILPATERERLLIEFNQASVSAEPLQEPFVHRMFEAQVVARPHAVALRDAAGECSYDELNRAANRLAHQLIAHGASRGARVAVFGERGRPMVQAFVATLKAGAVYLPVDPDYPSERLRYMLGDSEPAVVLATLASHGKVRELGYAGPMLILDEADGAIARETREHDLSVDDLALRPEHPAYMIYTSGSTGHPKAAINHHRGLAGMVKASVATLGVDRDSRMLQFASPSFDGSVFELTCALSSGATVCLGTRESLRPGAPLLEALNSYQITHVVLPSSALQACGDDAPVPTRVTLMLAGEALPPALAKRWAATNRVFNFYGPTETSVATSAHRCETLFEGSVPIGRPLSHCRVHLLDEHGRLAPIGVPGELCIGGSGVGLGYWRREDLNEERFIADPFADSFAPQAGRADSRLYRSGDMARWREDGTIEYLGRNDFQIKLRGFRIELGEIEARLCEIDGVREAAVIAREDRQDTRLVAYVVGEEGVTLDAAFLRERLAQKLAEFMLPSAFVPLPALPLNQNGKLDRKALPAPDMAALLSRDYAAPASASERTLAQIWSELLGVERVGRHDHFFELGGHSLSAIKLVYLLKQRLQASLPLAAVFASPTLAALAEAVDAARGGDAPPLAPSMVVPLNAVSDAPALFCIHPIGGQIGFYRPLAQRLQSHWRVFGVQAAHDGGADLRAMSRAYADAIRAEQAQGPYRLLGWSTGGLFASAVADELIAQGAQVDYLGWVDTHAMTHRDALDEGRALTEAALAELRGNGFVLREALAQGERSIRELLQMPFDQAAPQLQRWLSPAMNVETFEHLKAQLAITQRHLQSLYAHESPSRTPTQAFWAGSGEAHTAAQASVRARSTHWIDADHYAMLSEPHVAAIADALQTFFAARSHA